MIFHPWIIGLIFGDITILFLILLGMVNAWKISKHWNFNQTTSLQFQLEKKTYLVSAIMNFAMGIQIALILLFVIAAEEISDMLPGAMCATGTISSNDWGFPLLFLKLFLGFFSFFWLIINYIDNQKETYPLVREKYQLLLIITPLFIFQTVVTLLFISDLDPSVITSCCGVVFNNQSETIGGFVSNVDITILLPLILGSLIIIFIVNNPFSNHRKQRQKLCYFDILLWILMLSLGLVTIINFTSIYIYEMPTHKCPFCLLQKEYYYIGIPIYISLFLAVATGVGEDIIRTLESTVLNRSEDFDFLKDKLNRTAMISISVFIFLAFVPFVTYFLKTGSLL